MSSPERSEMDDRVHAQLVADALSCGLTSDEALRWADSRMKSTQAAMIRINLAGSDVTGELRAAAESAGARVARAMSALRS